LQFGKEKLVGAEDDQQGKHQTKQASHQDSPFWAKGERASTSHSNTGLVGAAKKLPASRRIIKQSFGSNGLDLASWPPEAVFSDQRASKEKAPGRPTCAHVKVLRRIERLGVQSSFEAG
jgi:hypothetical protein